MAKYVKPFLMLMLAAIVVGCGGSAPETETAVSLTSCTLGGVVDAQCGTISVPENYDDPNGRSLELAVAVLPAVSSTPDEDAIFLLAGGPGQAAIEAFPFALRQLEDLNQTRDLVLVDQRGTGDSNGLSCSSFLEPLPFDADEEAVFAAIADCRDALAEDNDLSQYVTDIAMRDLDGVREALGYEQINLIGTSYGSRAAQRYMALYPERVRTAVLNAVTSHELVIYKQSPQDGQRALELLFARCAADAACADAYPDLAETVDALLAMVSDGLETEIVHPISGEETTVIINEEGLMQTLFNLMYSAELVSILPLMLTEAAETADFSALIGQSLLISQSAQLYQGMFYAVTCSEDAAQMSLSEAEATNDGTLFPDLAVDLVTVCESWPEAELGETFRAPLESDIPTLLLSGEADPITPPVYAEQVLAGLENGRHFIIPHYGHDVLLVGCVPSLVRDFIADGSASELADECLAEVVPPPFFVSRTGPTP